MKLATILAASTHNPIVIGSPKDVFDLLSAEYKHAAKENFMCLFLNTKNQLIFKEVVSIGNLDSAIVHTREVFQAAIKICSALLIFAQSYPSRDPEPSFKDMKMTKRHVDAGKIIGIEVLDNIIINAVVGLLTMYNSILKHSSVSNTSTSTFSKLIKQYLFETLSENTDSISEKVNFKDVKKEIITMKTSNDSTTLINRCKSKKI